MSAGLDARLRVCGRSLDRVPGERIACSIFFSVVANGSYETCNAPFSILLSITPSNASTASVIFFW